MPPSIDNLDLVYNPVRDGIVLRPFPGASGAAGDGLPRTAQLRALELDIESGAWVKLRHDQAEGWAHLREAIPAAGARLPWLVKAHTQIGISEAEHPDVIRNRYVETTKKVHKKDPDWCACFVSWCMKDLEPPQEDLDHGNSQVWAEWGNERTPPPGGSITDGARVGDLVVGQRSPTRGHVGFFLGATAGHVLVLGGNQSMNPLVKGLPKSVRYGWYPIEHEQGRLRTVRRSPDFP